jgi:CTP synthase (UTP-ammonia lyase)
MGAAPFPAFHWCSYGRVGRAVPALEWHGVRVGARAVDAGVVAIELPDHPFYVVTLFQPQVGTIASGRLSPLVAAFVDAVREGERSAGRATAGAAA